MTTQYKLFKVPSYADSEEEIALNKFLRSTTPLTIHRDFVLNGSSSFTVFTVEYFTGSQPASVKNSKKGKIDYREVLPDKDFTLFAKLREWRKETATNAGIAVYTIFTNDQLAQMAGKRPKSKAALLKISGIGEAKVSKYGQEALAIVADITTQQIAKPAA